MSESDINLFFERPILNSPYNYPDRHWELNKFGQPTHRIIEKRRMASFITPIPKPKKQKGKQQAEQLDLLFNEGLDTQEQAYDQNSMINAVRSEVDKWRTLPKDAWRVTPETARLLEHWRHYKFNGIRPFFCQVEAAEVAIYLTEVAHQTKEGREFLDHLKRANHDANPEIMRLALKLATGAGKTTVMAMIIAWQTINAVRRPTSKKFTRGFLITTPGLTIKDRLRVLKPNDPDSYYKSRELVPEDMLGDLNKAKIVITNYHAYKRREKIEISKGGKALLQGRTGEEISTIESEGQMLQRVMPELMGIKGVLAINDEAHHCYRAKPEDPDAVALKGDDKAEAQENNEAARIWISGLEIVNRHIGLLNVIDLSATPFFLRGSGYAEGTMFPWTMSDFSLMDAIECGIVKLPRVPVADNIPGEEMPMYRNLWEKIKMPKKARGKENLDPKDLDTKLITALEALYGHYQKTYELWQESGIKVPPCFIIVCNNTASSKLVYDFISGYEQKNEDGSITPIPGKFQLFRNYDEHGNRLGTPHTLLIDSKQLESGEKFDDKFYKMEAEAIERFRNEIIERTGDVAAANNISDEDILREVMNTVGKEGRLGGSIRCVVSVSMLTEGWDANTVTHVLGVRAFGTQLLCEQVIGRALRRQSYELNEEGLFNVEYADVLGIPFDFNAKPVIAPPQPPRETIRVKAISPERSALEIRFPRVKGYRVDLPDTQIHANFTDDSEFILSQDLIGATKTENQGIIGQGIELTLAHTNRDMRESSVLFELTKALVTRYWRDSGEAPPLYLFGALKKIAREWMRDYLKCEGGTYPAQILMPALLATACEKISAAIVRDKLATGHADTIKAILDPYSPEGSTRYVNFTTSKQLRWETSPLHCHVNWAILDSDWEGEFCRVVEQHPLVKAYVKNHNLGFEVPYTMGSENRMYRPDFIILIDDGHGEDDLLHLVVEIKGYRGEDVKLKNDAIKTYWIPGVNRLKEYGRWAFTELRGVRSFEDDFDASIDVDLVSPSIKNMKSEFNNLIESAIRQQSEEGK